MVRFCFQKNFTCDDGVPGSYRLSVISRNEKQMEDRTVSATNTDQQERPQWGSKTEFLMSCVAFSVGLGNVWRFPSTAYENGGGAFLIPYIIVLFIIGKPVYYMEMILGQFSSRSCVEVWSVSPGFKGIGYGTAVSVFAVVTYYCSLMALTLYYLLASFQSVLPWAFCWEEWGDVCFDSTSASNETLNINKSSSADLYFRKVVLNEVGIQEGLGEPSWKLVLALLFSWACVFVVLRNGVKSSGKAAYFLALFPYVIMITLLVRAVTLDGAMNGIIFLFMPAWEKIMDPRVWYAAVTQSFFSLGVCFGAVTMYSSYNRFDHNVLRDCTLVTTMDLCTSLIAGTTIFGILGNLAHESGKGDISTVVRAGTGLAFISYPEALAKFTVVPQLFAVLFFLMLFVLGIGTTVAFTSVISSIVKDKFPRIQYWKVAAGVTSTGFLIGIVYCTRGGQYILNLVDYFGGTFIVVFLASFELIAISWVYGLDNFLDDVEFMTGHRPSFYWRLCWGFATPLALFTILVYFLSELTPLVYNDEYYPTSAYAAGWILLVLGVIQLPVWMIINKLQNKGKTASDILQPNSDWGPKDPIKYKEWREFKDAKRILRMNLSKKRSRIVRTLIGD
ncbi:PREDICTED: sodium-dependent nutrient amino acid transporter 1-like [Dufourea novaeangliae]|uniref:sodium-dependent nutrient amino acid transporter 1-like n=1 Tax=Dufourea novaeangliae TaxID=178035 RepID=UPI000767A841|nr:PREDICTED: sodium-dependent nutrient amino acid transporter 1-like [Dufourea novaeangliae]